MIISRRRREQTPTTPEPQIPTVEATPPATSTDTETQSPPTETAAPESTPDQPETDPVEPSDPSLPDQMAATAKGEPDEEGFAPTLYWLFEQKEDGTAEVIIVAKHKDGAYVAETKRSYADPVLARQHWKDKLDSGELQKVGATNIPEAATAAAKEGPAPEREAASSEPEIAAEPSTPAEVPSVEDAGPSAENADAADPYSNFESGCVVAESSNPGPVGRATGHTFYSPKVQHVITVIAREDESDADANSRVRARHGL